MADSLPALAFLGAGSMGGAILRGVVASGVAVDGGITATNRSRVSAADLADLPGVTTIALEERPDGNRDALASARIVLVGVKPGMVPDLLREIAPHLAPDAIVVSLAAGVTLATFADALGADVHVIRSMPNTPATVGKAVTGLAAGPASTPDDMALVRRLFETVGAVIEVPESQIDALDDLGFGPRLRLPAHRGMDEGRPRARLQRGGRPPDGGADLHRLDGAARSVGETPTEMRRRVTSPKGTTERAIAVLQDAHLEKTFADASAAALARARELAAGA